MISELQEGPTVQMILARRWRNGAVLACGFFRLELLSNAVPEFVF